MRAWITSTSSSRSSQIASQYSSKAGWNSLAREVTTASILGLDPSGCVSDSGRSASTRVLVRISSHALGAPPEDSLSGVVGTVATWSRRLVPEARSPATRWIPSPRPCGRGSRRRSPSPPRRRHPRGRPSPRATTRCCAPRPDPARPSPRSSGRSTGWSRRHRRPDGRRPGAGSTSRRCGRSRSTSRRTCGARCAASPSPPSASASASSSRPSGCAPATPRDERRNLVRHPPDILITTPESLYLMLTSAARETLLGVQSVIIDEIHALAPTKRGAHLALTLERLEQLVANGRPRRTVPRPPPVPRSSRAPSPSIGAPPCSASGCPPRSVRSR